MSVSHFSPRIPSAPVSLAHRFVPGLRFEDVLTYKACAHGEPARWVPLPLDPETPEDFADDGAWWCVRRCAAVLLRRPWQELQLPPHLPVRAPGAQSLVAAVGDVTRTLWSLLPHWDVVCLHKDAVRDPVAVCAPALLGGGSALLLMQSQEMDGRSPSLFWAWVVGLEMQGPTPADVLALLTIPFGWPMPWSCGYAARVHRNMQGLCDVGGVSGRWHMSSCVAAITLAERHSA